MSKEATSNFDELLKAIADVGDDADTLAKSEIPAGKEGAAPDDKTIAAASKDSKEGEDDEIDQDQVLSKALTVLDADGKPVEAIDATDMIKSLQDKVAGYDDVLAKALGGIGAVLKKQTDLIKSLQDNVAKLAGQGSGRKAVFMAVEKPGIGGDTMAKSGAAAEGQLTVEDFFAKANTAFDAQKISGQELNTISVCIRQNVPIDAALIRKVAMSS